MLIFWHCSLHDVHSSYPISHMEEAEPSSVPEGEDESPAMCLMLFSFLFKTVTQPSLFTCVVKSHIYPEEVAK